MKCIKCKVENINKANYCKKCGYQFSEREQKAARKWNLVWFLEQIDNVKSILDLSFITDHIIVKIGTIIVILGIGIYSWVANGIHLKLLASDDYQIQYNTELKEYYLLASEDEVKLNLYIPDRAEKITIRHLDKDNFVIDEEIYENTDKIILYSNGNDDYYTLETEYENDNLDRIKLYIYRYYSEEE